MRGTISAILYAIRSFKRGLVKPLDRFVLAEYISKYYSAQFHVDSRLALPQSAHHKI